MASSEMLLMCENDINPHQLFQPVFLKVSIQTNTFEVIKNLVEQAFKSLQ